MIPVLKTRRWSEIFAIQVYLNINAICGETGLLKFMIYSSVLTVQGLFLFEA